MVFILMLLQFVSPQKASAQQCTTQLKSILGSANQSVANNFDSSEPCYKAAMVGQSEGPPGCFPPDVFKLQNVLKPHVTKAQGVCKKACAAEGKKDECLQLVSVNNLKQNGILGILEILDSGL